MLIRKDNRESRGMNKVCAYQCAISCVGKEPLNSKDDKKHTGQANNRRKLRLSIDLCAFMQKVEFLVVNG